LITAIGPGAVTALKGNGNSDSEEELTAEELRKRLRYHKIVLLCDADVDGAHIRTLILTFFYRYAREIIENGHLFIAQPPLYLVKKGKTQNWIYSDKELEQKMKQIGRDGVTVQRYKGLGEMNPEQLWDTTLNPDTRTMLRVDLDDAEVADEIFKILMGTEVEPRREFIEKHAKDVKRLDV
jgi:DNA gyrase subunit B